MKIKELLKHDAELLSHNRAKLMGLMSIWVAIFHFTYPFSGRIPCFLQQMGYGGVDVFFLLSGLSMNNSFFQSCNKDIRLFYKKRIIRVLPGFALFFVVAKVIDFAINPQAFELIGDQIKTLHFWQNLITYRWYIPALLLFYLLTPIIDKFLLAIKQRNVSRIVIFMFTYLVVVFLCMGKSTVLMMILRLPQYIIGYWLGSFNDASDEKNAVHKQTWYWIILLFRIVMVIVCFTIIEFCMNNYDDIAMADYGLWWIPWIVMTLPLGLILSELLGQIKGLSILEKIGFYSLEFYLWHWTVVCILESIFQNAKEKSLLASILSIPITMGVSLVFRKLVATMQNRLLINMKCGTNKI